MIKAGSLLLFLSGALASLGDEKSSIVTSDGRICDCHSTCKGAELVYYCGTDVEDVWVNPCLSAEFSELPFCDSSLDTGSRVADILSRIPDDEKLGSAGAIKTCASCV